MNSSCGTNLSANSCIADVSLEFLSNQRAKTYMPVVILVIIALVGSVVGNSVVFYVYMFRYKPSSANTFITALSASDFLMSLFAQPFDVVDLLQPYMYEANSLNIPCKCFRSLQRVMGFFSGYVILWVSFERWRKICFPLKFFPLERAKRLVAGSFVVSLLSAVPTIFLEGGHSIDIGCDDLRAVRCGSADEYKGTLLSQSNSLYAALVFGIGSLFFMYFIINVGITLCRRQKNKFLRLHCGVNVSDPIPSITNGQPPITDQLSNKDELGNDVDAGKPTLLRFSKLPDNDETNVVNACAQRAKLYSNLEQDLEYVKRDGVGLSMPPTNSQFSMLELDKRPDTWNTSENNRGNKPTDESGAPSRQLRDYRSPSSCSQSTTGTVNGIRKTRLSLILFLVCISAYINYVPYLTVQVLYSTSDVDSWRIKDSSVDFMFEFCFHSKVFSLIINPIIYALLNANFRQQVVQLFREVCRGVA